MSTASTSLGANESWFKLFDARVLLKCTATIADAGRTPAGLRPKVGWTMALDKLATQQRDHMAW
jgi:hypothetical protein